VLTLTVKVADVDSACAAVAGVEISHCDAAGDSSQTVAVTASTP
jgi:hypothetical protein